MAAAGADLVVVCSPVGAVAGILHQIAPALDLGCAVLDVAGVKGPVSDWSGLAPGGAFVGSHPMAGSELSGIAHARADLFVGATWVFTPIPTTAPAALARGVALAEALGAAPLVCTPAEHDRWVASLSHLPHLLAYALAQTARRRVPEPAACMAGGSYRDGARVAASPPASWAELLMANRQATAEAARAASAWLNEAASALEGSDDAALERLLRDAHSGRLGGAPC